MRIAVIGTGYVGLTTGGCQGEAQSCGEQTVVPVVEADGGVGQDGVVRQNPHTGGKYDPVISVITAVKNGMPYLPDLLNSVEHQDYPHVEHIVIDDGSTDGGETCKVLENAQHIKWWSRANRGQVPTQNEGLLAATGDLVSIICSDDMYRDSSVLSTVAASWRPGIHVLYGDTVYIGPDGRRLPYQLPPPGPIEPSDLLTECVLKHCSVFVEREFLLKRHLLFDESFRFAADWDWLIRVFSAARENVLYVPAFLGAYRQWENQTSNQSWVEGPFEGERKRILAMYGGSATARRERGRARLWPYRWQKLRGLWHAGGPAMTVHGVVAAVLRRMSRLRLAHRERKTDAPDP